jgi:hypothetical protein
MALMDGAEANRILKRDALGRVTLPREQREALLDEFERSGLPAAQFARAAGIRYQTFACWVQKRRHARDEYADLSPAAPAALRLLEVVSAQAAEQQCQPGGALEVVLPGGAKLLVASTAQVELAAQLLKAFAFPC